MAEPVEPCADCGKKIQMLWCPLWEAWLCVFCRASRTAQDLRESQRKWFIAGQAAQ